MSEHLFDLKDLKNKISLEGSFEPGDIDFTESDLRQSGPLSWTVSAERAGEEIRINGTFDGAVELNCSRCLEPARCGISRSFELFFREHDEEIIDEDDDVELTDDDMRTSYFVGTQMDIGDIIREQVLLSLPMKVLCKVECKGLCPVCGTNLNINTCNCSVERFSPHIDKLQDIKKRLEERSS
jgi:uncharacterized protein